uniref:Uncharacterized protein n=1 Tax=Glossina austeni TaxID=7395 RepID=A0A1A9VHM2_GLOAU
MVTEEEALYMDVSGLVLREFQQNSVGFCNDDTDDDDATAVICNKFMAFKLTPLTQTVTQAGIDLKRKLSSRGSDNENIVSCKLLKKLKNWTEVPISRGFHKNQSSARRNDKSSVEICANRKRPNIYRTQRRGQPDLSSLPRTTFPGQFALCYVTASAVAPAIVVYQMYWQRVHSAAVTAAASTLTYILQHCLLVYNLHKGSDVATQELPQLPKRTYTCIISVHYNNKRWQLSLPPTLLLNIHAHIRHEPLRPTFVLSSMVLYYKIYYESLRVANYVSELFPVSQSPLEAERISMLQFEKKLGSPAHERHEDI